MRLFRHRNGKAQRASMIQSVELLEQTNHDRKTIDHEMVGIYRRKSADIPLAVVFTLARDGGRAEEEDSGGRSRTGRCVVIELLFRLRYFDPPGGTTG